ncbi:thiamine/thiamine pyrophosphate ABC transporter permease ThiP [Aestuariibius sp. 2305UL40-4]|uniref:thiamine/thiamine pyrophosphate ABC transporter permease ThiP n=1 Tax=Aestuariibius violaceus TaxID=3234132 RepID=UPI00398EF45E
MAVGADAVTRLFGWGAAALVIALVFGPLAAVVWRADWDGGLVRADWLAVRFTVWQAVVSAAVSVGLAVPVARALSRQTFPGRGLYIALLGAPFILPTIVAILGLLAVFGRQGWLNDGLGLFGVEIGIYGWHGVILAHVFFNLPLAVRFLLQGWQAIPAERFRLVESLGGSVWQLLERPMLVRVVPGAAVVIFLICLTTFAVALTLGGGPRATTVELAIYQAFRFEFDLGRVSLLALVQIALCIAALIVAGRVPLGDGVGIGRGRDVLRRDARWWDYAWIVFAAIFLGAPLLAIVATGVPGLAELPGRVWEAALRSVIVALAATALALGVAVALIVWARGARWVEALGALPLAVSGLVVGAGLFLWLAPLATPSALALPLTTIVNAMMVLPFAVRLLAPAYRDIEKGYGPLADALGMTGWARLRWLTFPRLRRPLGFCAGLAAALSMGDLGVIALFAGTENATLPLTVYQLMGSYRTEAAGGAALLLLTLSVALFWLFDRGGRLDADV